MAQTSLRPKKTALLVAQRIVSDIARGGNRVGDRLPPEHLMLEQYGVGRGVLRESLRFLELQGVISLKPGPGGGPVVQHPDSSVLATALTLLLQFENAPFRAIVEARTALEPMMAQLAAERMSDEEISELKSNVDNTRRNVNDLTIFHDEISRFHDIVARGSGNQLFAHLINALLGILDGSAMGIEYPETHRLASCTIHDDIYEAIAARDSDAAQELMNAHIQAHAKYTEFKFKDVLDSPIQWNKLA